MYNKSLIARQFRPVEGTRFLSLHGPHRAALLCVACLWVGEAGACASLLDYHPASAGEILLAQRAIADSIGEPAAFEAIPPPPGETMPAAVTPVDIRKSPGRAVLLNLIVPGAGHLYAGNKRGWINLGLEGMAWVTYLYYHDRGTSKEDEYEDHADEHWDLERWRNSEGGRWRDTPEDSLITHFLASNKQHYYEDIVKLNTYAGGWDDPSNRSFNRGMRNDSNNFLKNARYAVVGTFVNRVVSAVDVLRLLKNKGRASLGNDTQLRFRLRTKPFARENAFGIQITKRL
jgi:hypothetical protein